MIEFSSSKGCNQCKHLEWVDGDTDSTTGYTCNKRQEEMYRKGVEHILLRDLDNEKYRKKYKRCFESNI